MKSLNEQLKRLPNSPGVYLFQNARGSILYIGKATSLKQRVRSYFRSSDDARIQTMVSQIVDIEIRPTASALEALLLEAELIKKYQPYYNVMEKDDKTFAYIGITSEPIPRVIVTRPTKRERVNIKYLYGPYTSAVTARTALKILRKIFPFHTRTLTLPSPKGRGGSAHSTISQRKRVCFDASIGLCSGVCGGKQSLEEYRAMLARLRLFLQGKRERAIASLKQAMLAASKRQRFEEAARIRDQLTALKHIRDVALLTRDEFDAPPRGLQSYHIPGRIEAYDISHVFGEYAVGSMVVFTMGRIDSDQYRRFRIRGASSPDDTRMIAEVLTRRFQHNEWRQPDLLLIDGGRPQLHAAQVTLRHLNLTIPVAALAKGPTRKKADLYSSDPMAKLVPLPLLIKLREESHRFAIRYHRLLKRKGMF